MSEKLTSLYDEAWQYKMKTNPVYASFCGNNEYNDQLPTVSLESFQEQHEQAKAHLKKLEELTESVPEEEEVNVEVLRLDLEDQIAKYDYNSHLMPINSIGGFHLTFPELANYMRLSSAEDFQSYIARLQAFPKHVQENILLMKEGIARGYVPSRVSMAGCELAIQSQIVTDPTKSPAYTNAIGKLSNEISPENKKKIEEGIRSAIKDSLVPAYQEFYNFVHKEYLPSCRDSYGVMHLENGKSYYEYLVHHFTTLNVTPQQVHETGLLEVERISGEMHEIFKELNFSGSIRDFAEHLKQDSRFYAKTPEDLVKEICWILKRMDGCLPQLFKRLPRMPYGVEPVPDYSAPKMPTAYYLPPTGDGTRGGIYFINTYDLPSRPLYEMESLSLHEAVPGHHLQIALQQELKNVPTFRRFHMFTSYVEGWALYAERLGLEVGFYTTPYNNFGRLLYEMWRACRLVVDTGIHYFDWSRDKAIEYLLANSVLSKHNIETEVNRYISMPGQAISYKMGELEIRSLRSRAEEKLQEKFSIRDFHDVVLKHGAIPLNVLEKKVDHYIEERGS